MAGSYLYCSLVVILAFSLTTGCARLLLQSERIQFQDGTPFVEDPATGQRLFVDLNGNRVRQPGVPILVEEGTNRIYVHEPLNLRRLYIGSDESRGERKAGIDAETGQVYLVSPDSGKRIYLEIVVDATSLPAVANQVKEIMRERESRQLQQPPQPPGTQVGSRLRAPIQIDPSLGQAFIVNPRTLRRIFLQIFVDPTTLAGVGEPSAIQTEPITGRLFVPNPVLRAPTFVDIVPDPSPTATRPVDGPPIQIDFITGQAFVVDPLTLDVLFLNTLVVSVANQSPPQQSQVQIDPLSGQAFVRDPATGRRTDVRILPSINQLPSFPRTRPLANFAG